MTDQCSTPPEINMGNTTSLFTEPEYEYELNSQLKADYLSQFHAPLRFKETPLIKLLQTLSDDERHMFITELVQCSFSRDSTYTFPGDRLEDPEACTVAITEIDVKYIVDDCARAMRRHQASVLYIVRVIEVIGDYAEVFGGAAIVRGVKDLIELAYLINYETHKPGPDLDCEVPAIVQNCLAGEIEVLDELARGYYADWTGHKVDEKVYWKFEILCDNIEAFERVRDLVDEN